MNAVTYKEIFPMIAENRLWLGYNSGHFWFKVPDSYEIKKTDFKIDEYGQKWRRMGNICQYVQGDFSINHLTFANLTHTEQQQIMDYPLMIYICEGTDKEKLDWFKIINIAGEQLTTQELRNAIYTGEWLTEAKKYFSKTMCPAYNPSRLS